MTEDCKFSEMNEWVNYKQHSHELMGIVVVHVNVGLLPPMKAEALLERVKDRIYKEIDVNRLKQNYEIIFLPTREHPTHISYTSLK
jgi:hypothetical protein